MVDQFSEETAIQFAVIGDGQVAAVVMVVNHMAAAVVIGDEANFANAFPASRP
jgi:hypothetical protein